MEIAIDTLFEHPERPSSAIDYLKCLADFLPRAGPENSYHLFVSPKNRHHFKDITHSNLHLVNCFISNENVPLRILVQQSVLPAYMLRLRLDVLFSPGNVCPLLGNFCRVLKINTLHHYRDPALIGRTRSLYRKLAFAGSAQRADRVIANTLATKEELCRLMGVPESKISVVAEASYDFYRQASPDQTQEARARYGLSGDYILFASTLYPYKNPETLIRSFAKLAEEKSIDCQLVIAGRDHDSHQARLEELARTLAISARVRFLGFVPPEELRFLYSGARAFVYPSLAETFGKPLVEAMSCGVPIVASNTSCIPEVLAGAGILINPLDADEMSSAIYEALTNKALRANLIDRGLRRAQSFSWEATAKQTLGVIEDAFAERRSLACASTPSGFRA
jgi:glycosyltransferase involved in cell wall biosynthesis